ncbi:MAG TPA: DUF3775 domain-containing protein [Halomonas sp.]|nr:DUF3775 domain-containing protein [Halomonas sp.]
MLNINTDDVCRLIELAREFHAQDGLAVPGEPTDPAGGWPYQALSPRAGNRAFEEFRTIINGMYPGQQQEVVGLLWVGRGDYAIEEWADALAYAKQAWNEATADYLMAQPLVAEYLTEGLGAHGHRCG